MKTEPGKYYKNLKANQWIKRPKVNQAAVLDWIDYNNEGASPEQMESLKKRLDNARAFTTPPKKEFAYVDQFGNRESATDRIQELDRKKKIIKKKIVSVDKPQKPLPFSLDKWLDEIDPQWWILPDEVTPDEEAKNRLILKKKMKVAEGIESLMRLHRRLT